VAVGKDKSSFNTRGTDMVNSLDGRR